MSCQFAAPHSHCVGHTGSFRSRFGVEGHLHSVSAPSPALAWKVVLVEAAGRMLQVAVVAELRRGTVEGLDNVYSRPCRLE